MRGGLGKTEASRAADRLAWSKSTVAFLDDQYLTHGVIIGVVEQEGGVRGDRTQGPDNARKTTGARGSTRRDANAA